MLEAQAQHPVKGDCFFSESQSILKEFGMGLDNSEIKVMKRNYFRNLTKMKANEVAFTELINLIWQRTCNQTKFCVLKISDIFLESEQK